ncbi:MAG TPA: shikimate dehydrogenase, partial [Casimicrobiaceae bacterium]|nr:shikimate dehydrogenase [Casimicrobiaceae bacterium]
MITGKTELVAHIGYPTDAFKAPLIYNPWFESRGIDAIVVPMGCQPGDYPAFLRALFRLTNIRGALVTMPHKVNTVALLDVRNEAVDVAGSCNAVRRDPDGRLRGDMFDGAGFTRGVLRKGVALRGASCLVVGAGGVGSAIAASLAAERVASIAIFDVDAEAAHRLVARLPAVHPEIDAAVRTSDPAGYDVVVNATPLGMRDDDPLPFDAARLAPHTFVGEVV